MPQNHLILGNWNAICDICGLKFKATDLTKDWRGLMVCSKDFEQRHPQDFLRVRADDPSIPWARPEPEDVFLYVCYIWGRSAYADLAEADCAQADYQPFTYLQLLELQGPPDPLLGMSAIPLYAMAGFSIPGTLFPLA